MKKLSEEDRVTIEIIALCLDLDWKAAKLYTGFSENTSGAMSAFWKDLADDENDHVLYWKKLQTLTDTAVPQVFNNPDGVREELLEAIAAADKILKTPGGAAAEEHFLAAFKMEFVILNSAFATLFHYLKDASEEETPADNYNLHLEKLAAGLKKHGAASPALALTGETIVRLWEENRKLAVQNTLDPLTGVLNRQGLIRTILPMVFFAQRNELVTGVLMIGLDDFKKVNAARGHRMGDYALRAVADTIRTALRRSDVVCRYGGDVFLIFLPSIQPGTSSVVGGKIRAAVEENSYKDIKLTVSLGGCEEAMTADPLTRYEEMVRSADEALCAAKKAGKNRVVMRGTG